MENQTQEKLEKRAVELGCSVDTLIERLFDAERGEQTKLDQYAMLQARMAAIVESSLDAIISKTLDGTIVSWNASAERLFGYSASEAVGSAITIIFPPDRIDEEAMILERIRRGERLQHYETVRLHKDGHAIPVSVTISPIFDSSGKVIGASKIVRDITDRLQIERQQRDYEKALERARVSFLSEFVEGASHECRTPLAIINTSAYIVWRMNDPEKRAEKAKQISQQVNRINRLVGMLLTRVALESTMIEHAPFDPKVMLNDLRKFIEDIPVDGRAPIEWQISADLPIIDGSAVQISEALVQIVDNARQYTPSDGQIRVTAQTQGEQLVIEVADTGIGISNSDQPHIFKSFWRSDKARTTAGFGLGLAIAQKSVELNGGHIEVESELNKGSVFRVVLPSAER